jgi:hypothetical protein
MHESAAACAGPKCRDDAGIANLGELVAFLGQTLNVISEGLAQLLLATLQIPGVAHPHMCALKVASEDLLDILLAINRVPGQVVESGPGCVS